MVVFWWLGGLAVVRCEWVCVCVCVYVRACVCLRVRCEVRLWEFGGCRCPLGLPLGTSRTTLVSPLEGSSYFAWGRTSLTYT